MIRSSYSILASLLTSLGVALLIVSLILVPQNRASADDGDSPLGMCNGDMVCGFPCTTIVKPCPPENPMWNCQQCGAIGVQCDRCRCRDNPDPKIHTCTCITVDAQAPCPPS
jgi:hypothetical protein